MFGDRDFFTQAYEEAYVISEPEDTQEETEAPVDNIDDEQEEVEEVEETAPETQTPQELTPLQIKEMYEKYFGEQEQEVNNTEPELDEDTKSALELYRYLESNPHLVQAMREVDQQGYQQLNTFVPDEITKQLQELKDFQDEYHYNMYVNELKGKYSDFDEDKVLEYAEKNDVTNLEVAYKALKAEKMQEPNMEEIKAQVKAQIMEELKQNSLNTQSIVGGITQKPITQDDDVKLTSKQARIAKAMGMSPSEYAKWS